MKVIVGLGNPGPRYERTRHNAGFMVADRLLARHAPGSAAQGRFHSAAYDTAIAGERCLILKPTLYMNRSGAAVAEAASFYKVDPARSGDRIAGSGLGLSIVKAIVERHGGSVSASSIPGVSTEFAIHLPVSVAA